MALTEQDALMILNGFKSDLSRLGHSIDQAFSNDGKIDGLEGMTISLTAGNMGLSYYYQYTRLKGDLKLLLDVIDRATFTLE